MSATPGAILALFVFPFRGLGSLRVFPFSFPEVSEGGTSFQWSFVFRGAATDNPFFFGGTFIVAFFGLEDETVDRAT